MDHHPNQMVLELSKLAYDLRLEVVKMVFTAGSGHIGGSMSAAEIVTALMFHHLRLDPKQPDWPERDRFLLSKGHAAPILYAALAHRGFFPVAELATLRQLSSRLLGHPDRLRTPGVEMTTGFLGHGISIGVGLALAARLEGGRWKVYVLVGDGELQAGVIWEGAMAAAKFDLGNLTVIVDYNHMQLDGPTQVIMPIEPLKDKWRSFGWRAWEIDGHDIRQILDTLDEADQMTSKPKVILADTVKGKGVSFMEGQQRWHSGAPTKEEYIQAIRELERKRDNG